MTLRPTKAELQREIADLIEAAQDYDEELPSLAFNFRWEARIAYRQLKAGWYKGGEPRPKPTVYINDPFQADSKAPVVGIARKYRDVD